MGQPPTEAKIRRTLSQALSDYQEQDSHGGDMAEAGRQLARVVGHIFQEPVCGLPRVEYLRELREQRERERRQKEELRELRELERELREGDRGSDSAH